MGRASVAEIADPGIRPRRRSSAARRLRFGDSGSGASKGREGALEHFRVARRCLHEESRGAPCTIERSENRRAPARSRSTPNEKVRRARLRFLVQVLRLMTMKSIVGAALVKAVPSSADIAVSIQTSSRIRSLPRTLCAKRVEWPRDRASSGGRKRTNATLSCARRHRETMSRASPEKRDCAASLT
jgi:hypothetical protein